MDLVFHVHCTHMMLASHRLHRYYVQIRIVIPYLHILGYNKSVMSTFTEASALPSACL